MFAIGITELRDIFGASPDLAARLRQIAADHLPTPTGEHRRRGTLLGRIGPALKQPIDKPEAPKRPTLADVDALLAGRTVGPERLGYAWHIALVWLAELSWGRLDLDLDEAQLTTVEFDLARAGLPSTFALERLLQGNPQIPLRPLPGQRFGYAKNSHVEATRQGLSTVIGDVAEESLTTTGTALEFLNNFPEWTRQAAQTGRPAPDLVVVWMG